MALIKTNVPGFYKDPKTNAIVNGSDDYKSFQEKRRMTRDVDNLKNAVNSLNRDINEIKDMLTLITGALSNEKCFNK